MDFIYLDELEHYHSGQMSSTERAMFETRLKQDPELSRENDAYTLITQGIVLDGEKALRSNLEAIRLKLQNEHYFDTIDKPKTTQNMEKRPVRWAWLAAAAIMIIAVAVVVFFPQNAAVSTEEAFAQYYKPETTVLTKTLEDMERSGFADAEPANDTLTRALKAYEAGEYPDALTNLNLFLLDHPDDQLGNMYLGLTLMQMSEYGKAIGKLSPLAIDEQFAHKNTARWYLALCLTQVKGADTLKQAKGWFKLLGDDVDSGYSKEAKGMMELLAGR